MSSIKAKSNNIENINKTATAIFAIYTVIFSILYYSSFSVMIKWWSRDDYSYCYLIPFIVLYLMWERKDLFFHKPTLPDWKGLGILIFGILLFWIGELGGEFYTIYLSSWIILIGLCILNMGTAKQKTIFFPLCFILTMFPFPNFINNRITLYLKTISTKLGVMMMQAYGLSTYREGNVIDLGFTQLQVVDACSGLRYLFPMVVLSILIASFNPGRLWKRVFIVLSSIPLTIFSNSFRIALTGILSEKFGPKAVQGFFHDFEGWIIFMLTLVLLMLEIWILKKMFPNPEPKKDDAEIAKAKPSHDARQGKGTSFKSPQFIVSVVLLVLTLVLSLGIEFREAIPISRSFDEFPEKIGEWEGDKQLMEQKFIDALDLSDYFMADYADKSGRFVNFYVAYYESQRKGESIHSPATCLRGGGWDFKQAGSQAITLNDGTVMLANRALIEKAPVRQLSYYWFPCRGRILTNAIQMKIYTFWDALTRKRTDGALVRVITLVYEDEEVEDAEKRIQAFISDIQPVLKTFLPE